MALPLKACISFQCCNLLQVKLCLVTKPCPLLHSLPQILLSISFFSSSWMLSEIKKIFFCLNPQKVLTQGRKHPHVLIRICGQKATTVANKRERVKCKEEQQQQKKKSAAQTTDRLNLFPERTPEEKDSGCPSARQNSGKRLVSDGVSGSQAFQIEAMLLEQHSGASPTKLVKQGSARPRTKTAI